MPNDNGGSILPSARNAAEGEAGFPSEIRNSLLPPLAIGRRNLAEEFDFVQAFPGAFRHRAQWIFRDVHWQAGLFAQEPIEPAQERATTGEHQTAIDQVGGQLRRATLEGDPD